MYVLGSVAILFIVLVARPGTAVSGRLAYRGHDGTRDPEGDVLARSAPHLAEDGHPGFVAAGDYRGVAMFVYAFHLFVQYLFSFYGYERNLMDGFTFGLVIPTFVIVLAHHTTENWSWSERRIDS